MPVSVCKGCQKNITWIRTKAGKQMPCDSYGPYAPNSGGIIVTKGGEVIAAEKIKGSILAYRPHWGNCPAVKDFKKPKTPEDLS